jgi:hypothetical protein
MDTNRASLLAELLHEMRTEGDYLPDEAWFEIQQAFALPYVELVVPLCSHRGWKVYLTRRLPDDPFWPSTWHLPGGLWRTHQSQLEACQAIAARELGVSIATYKEIMTHKWNNHLYGNPISHVCVCEPSSQLVERVDRGYFEELPEPFVAEQKMFVEAARVYLSKLPAGNKTLI